MDQEFLKDFLNEIQNFYQTVSLNLNKFHQSNSNLSNQKTKCILYFKIINVY